jgi:D-3-phosphoglycerate dehydrogenase
VIVRSRTKLTRDIIERGKNLKVIGRAGVGVDNIDVKKATEKGIKVVNAPRGSTHSVAELVFGHMLSLARHLAYADRSLREGKWEKKKLLGMELQGKTLGVIGFGRIGQEVWKLAQAFGMSCIAFDPYMPADAVERTGAKAGSLEDVLKSSDFITIHALLTDETRHMISEKQFEMMKPGAYLINCARGGIVDEEALYNAAKDGKIGGAALDVFENEPPKDSPLFELDNVYFTPHLGASTKEAQIRAGVTTAEQVLKVLHGEKPDFLVNRELA